jgi:O-antigen/teichoic acid export membrane protein
MYGIWLTLTSIIGWISYFDVGLGNGLRNKLAASIAMGNYDEGKIYISTIYFLMSVIFLGMGLFLYFIIPMINWASFLNISSIFNEQIINVLRIILVFFTLQMILKTLSNILFANQQSAVSVFLDFLGSLVSLVIIFILTKTVSPKLEYLAFAFSGSLVFVLSIASFIVFNFSKFYSKIAPSIKYIKIRYSKGLIGLGLNFFVIQVSVLILYQVTNIIISRISGPESVTIYNVAYKYLSAIMMVFNIILTPFWSSYTDAYTKQDYNWMKNSYSKLIKIFLIAVCVLIIMLFASPFAYKIWLGGYVDIPFSMSLVVAIYMVCMMWAGIHSTIANGIGKIKIQFLLSFIGIVFSIPMALFLGNHFGVEGVVCSTIVITAFCSIFLYIQIRKIFIQKVAWIWNE